MKYYAVTDDPNELMHFGIKGMKWGVIRTPEQLGHYKTTNARHYGKTRSAAYMRAKAKMSSSMQNGIAAVKAKWDDYNSPANVAARQRQKQINKAVRNYKKNERLFEKHVQLARQGRLKYKGIPDAEVERITNRLELENYARSQSGKEKQGVLRRVGSSMMEGAIQGVGQGVSNRVSEHISRKGRLKTSRMQLEQQQAFNELQADRNFNRWKSEQAYKDKYNDKRAKVKEARDARSAAEEDYETEVRANQIMGYDRIYGENGPRFNYEPGSAKRLTTTELKARTRAIQSAKKLYDSSEDAVVKAKSGKVTKKYTDENGNEVEETYSNGKGSAVLLGFNGAPRNTGASAADLDRMERQMKKQERAQARTEAKARADARKQREREIRFDLDKAGRDLAAEQRRAKWEAQYEKEQIHEKARQATKQFRQQQRLERQIAREYNQNIGRHEANNVHNRIGTGTPFSGSSSATQERQTWASADAERRAKMSTRHKRGRG